MANLTESSTYESGIFQLETNTPVRGGLTGESNTQATQLANRTKYLKDHVDSLESGATLHAATGKTTPVDADELPLIDSAASNSLKKLTFANLKATQKTYFDTLYSTIFLPTTTISSSGGVVTIDLSAVTDRYEITLTENTTWAFTNYPPSGYYRKIVVTVIQHASAAKTMSSPASTGRTAGGIAWVVSTVLSSREALEIHAFSDSTRTLFPTGVQV